MIDEIGALRELLAGRYRSMPSMCETWQDNLGIDPTVWGTTLVGTGAVARDLTEAPYHKVVLTGPVNADTARLYTNQTWQCAPDMWGNRFVIRRLVMEWEAKFTLVASINNPTFFMGLGSSLIADRAANNVIGFILTADALNSLTDDGGAETVKALGAPTITAWCKYKLDTYYGVGGGVVDFYINDERIVRHMSDDTENIPDNLQYGTFYLPQEAGANSAVLHLGVVRLWHEDLER